MQMWRPVTIYRRRTESGNSLTRCHGLSNRQSVKAFPAEMTIKRIKSQL